MPAKKKEPEKSKKAENKVKEKIIEDKTFGLKNKNKSATVQKFIKGVQQQVKGVPKGGEAARLAAQLNSKEEKKKVQADQALLASLFKTVVDMPKGEDPKSIICSYYKSGLCQKGDKCKFSHDLSLLPVKQEKIDLYADRRTGVSSDITCQFFMDAVENDKYGWFWKCPNGDECIYRHALPEDYVFKKEEVKVEDDYEDKPTLEEEIDKERSLLPLGQKPVTFEEFMGWVNEQFSIRQAEKEEEKKKLKGLSGKLLFETNAGLFQDDEDAYDEYQRDEGQEEEEEKDTRFVSEGEEKKEEEEGKNEEEGREKEIGREEGENIGEKKESVEGEEGKNTGEKKESVEGEEGENTGEKNERIGEGEEGRGKDEEIKRVEGENN
jgi:hypothetical protein